MSKDNEKKINGGSSSDESSKMGLSGSTTANLSSDFRSTNATQILPEAKGATVRTGNTDSQGQTGTTTNKTTTGQVGEGIHDIYKKIVLFFIILFCFL